MKKLLALFLVLWAACAMAQTGNSTPNLQFSLPAHGSSNWDAPLNTNFSLLDQYLSGQKTLPQSFWANFLTGLTLDYSKITNKPSYFPADWNSTIINKPSTFAPTLPTISTPGGVFMPTSCPAGYHVSAINLTNGQLICTADTNSSFQFIVNGTVIATGITALNFNCSSGLQCTGAYNNTTGVMTLTVTGSTATQAQSVTASPLPGSYSSTQSVTLACASPSPTIFYTTDGTTPTHSGGTPTGTTAIYSTAISASNTTIKAICTSSGLADSNLISFIYSLTAPAVSLNPTSLSYTAQKVGTSSATQQIAMTNTGNGTLGITSITASGDYSQTNNCGSTLGAGLLCSISVTFSPTTTGTRTGTITVTDNASGSPHTASLSGVGARPTGSVAPTSLTFGSQTIGTTSGTQSVTLTNTGSVTMVVSSVTLSGTNAGDYGITSSTCGTVGAGGTCTASVSFTPTVAGTRTATLNFTSDASNSPQTVSITGTGANPPAPVANLGGSLTFGGQKVGTASASQGMSLSNTGNATLAISSIGITGTNSGDFGQTNNCGSSVAAGSSCTITVTFTPSAAGTRTASVSVIDNAAGSPQTSGLTGTGVSPSETDSPSSLSFGNVVIGGSSTAQTVTITNTSSVVLLFTSIGVTGDFSQSNTCGTSLGASAQCTVTVVFNPVATGTRTGTLTITDDATGSPHTVSLTGVGTQPIATITGGFSNFNHVCGTVGPQTVTMTNTGNATMSFNGLGLANVFGSNLGGFAPSTTCGATIAPGASCSISVTASGGGPPGTSGSIGATLVINDNAAGAPQTMSLGGTVQCP